MILSKVFNFNSHCNKWQLNKGFKYCVLYDFELGLLHIVPSDLSITPPTISKVVRGRILHFGHCKFQVSSGVSFLIYGLPLAQIQDI